LKSFLIFIAFFFCILIGIQSCKTDDIYPVVVVSIDSLQNERISENGGKAYLRATLNGASKNEIRLSFTIAGSAINGTDYNLSASQLIIPAGKTTASIELMAMEDNLIESDETIIFNFVKPENITMLEGNSKTIIISDDDSDTDKDGIPDASDLCPLDSGSAANNGCPPGFGLVINEVLYDPSNIGLEGDANGDGIYDQIQDEFIELVNNTNSPKDISGFTISELVIVGNISTIQFTFPAGTVLSAKKAALVFGGGTPTGSFGNAIVFQCSTISGLSLGNSSEKIELRDKDGNLLEIFDSDVLSGNPNESYTRNPDVTGDFVQHATATPGVLFSPGKKINGAPF